MGRDRRRRRNAVSRVPEDCVSRRGARARSTGEHGGPSGRWPNFSHPVRASTTTTATIKLCVRARALAPSPLLSTARVLRDQQLDGVSRSLVTACPPTHPSVVPLDLSPSLARSRQPFSAAVAPYAQRVHGRHDRALARAHNNNNTIAYDTTIITILYYTDRCGARPCFPTIGHRLGRPAPTTVCRGRALAFPRKHDFRARPTTIIPPGKRNPRPPTPSTRLQE